MKYLLTLAYVGTNYHGWQVQPNGRSVQETVQDAIEALFGKRYGLTGCSRTDSGVHANMFCATVETDANAPQIPAERLPVALGRHLPPDISVRQAIAVSDAFHARYSVCWKRYVYRIDTAQTPNPFLCERAYHLPQKLNIAAMQEAANAFVGTHDFAGFMASGSTVKDTVRTVYECIVRQTGDLVELSIAADGFLYNMVRIWVGTLLAVSRGKINPAEMPDLLQAKRRELAGETVPAAGLYLDTVSYLPFPQKGVCDNVSAC